MKKYLVYFLSVLMIFMKIQNTISLMSSSQVKGRMTTNKEIDDLIEYLAKETDKNYREIMSQQSKSEEPNFIETKLTSEERGMGCEAFNKCSGKGSCSNGACVCDEGYDYFDCSVNLLSKIY